MTRILVPARTGLGPSGGDRYDAALAAAWRDRGRDVELLPVPGPWPDPGPAELERLAELVSDAPAGPVLLDGLVGCAAPEVVEGTGRPLTLLVHALLADGAGATGDRAAALDAVEQRALAAASTVIVTSGWAARRLTERHGRRDVVIAPPGTTRAPVARGGLATTGTPGLLALGAVSRVKNQALLLDALERVADLPWRLVVAGPVADPDLARTLEARTASGCLAGRVTWAGTVEGEELERLWDGTDLLMHPSRSETYGMAVAEALAHGIPAVVGAGTGAEEVLAGEGSSWEALAGAAVPTDDPGELAETLRRWLTDAPLRQVWRRRAHGRRNLLTGWGRTAEQIDRALDRIGP
ncbi:glycosyltransferase family 4 protein [Ornithinimicrobium humiphilum]|uniref:D-inositol 3-phosphate glycosyltransferase n=1 Tax=Ornithinimicrobium humiphilum TaxID=125288 RepID=A0A543KJQ7_9MICO|nr:glycosyltransferase family 4 protein [Ornithinimicrobium humiphilum]TQM95311.1 glycosyl transferase family 1 [Ornithinimicrobium humiphilum]